MPGTVAAAIVAVVAGCVAEDADEPCSVPRARASGVELRTPSGVLRAGIVDLAQGGLDLLVAHAAAEPRGTEVSEGALSIRADALSLDGQRRTAAFRGGVVVLWGPLTLSCDRLTATLDEGGGVASASAEGSLRVLRADLDVTAACATLDVAAAELVLAGPVVLRRPDATVQADRVVINLLDQRVTISKVRGQLRLARAGRPGRQR